MVIRTVKADGMLSSRRLPPTEERRELFRILWVMIGSGLLDELWRMRDDRRKGTLEELAAHGRRRGLNGMARFSEV